MPQVFPVSLHTVICASLASIHQATALGPPLTLWMCFDVFAEDHSLVSIDSECNTPIHSTFELQWQAQVEFFV